MASKIIVLTIFFLCLFSQIETRAHIPFVQTLPEHPHYYQYYYKQLYQWFNRHHFDWKKKLPQSSQIPWQDFTSWAPKSNPQSAHLLLGVGYKKNGEIFYTLTFHHDDERVTYRSDNLSTVACHETQYKTCHKKKYKKLSKAPQAEQLPLHRSTSISSFIFADFVSYQEIWGSQDGDIIIYSKLNDIQTAWLPLELQKAILDIGIQTRLPVDKIEVNSNNEIILYYP